MTLLHCWMDKISYMEEKYGYGSEKHIEAMFNNGTCMLPKGHSGEHKFTPDKNITIRFLSEDEYKEMNK